MLHDFGEYFQQSSYSTFGFVVILEIEDRRKVSFLICQPDTAAVKKTHYKQHVTLLKFQLQ